LARWFRYLAVKIVPEMTYVFSGTLSLCTTTTEIGYNAVFAKNIKSSHPTRKLARQSPSFVG